MSGMSSMLRIALDWDIPSPNEPNEKGGTAARDAAVPNGFFTESWRESV
jgi:hypothetical protein